MCKQTEKRDFSIFLKRVVVEVEVERKTEKKEKSESIVDDAFVVDAVSIATRRVFPLCPFCRDHFHTEGLRQSVTMPPRKRRGAADEVSEKRESRRERRDSLLSSEAKKNSTPTKKLQLDSSPRQQQRAPRTPSAAPSSAWPLPSPRAPFLTGPGEEDNGKLEHRR